MPVVLSSTPVTDGIFMLRVGIDSREARPGQFYMLKLPYPLLPRPISLCEAGDGWVDFAVAAVGEGTRALSLLKPGDMLALTGPLGNGFPLEEIRQYRRIALISGGIGVAPFVELAKHLTGDVEVRSFCGFKDASYLTDRLPNVTVITESGRDGVRGLVTDCFVPSEFDLAIACGPIPMLRALKEVCGDLPALFSLEARMACGVGACLVCTCQTAGGNKRCCADGPVFRAEEVIV